MSHNYSVGCRCGEDCEGSWNHAEEELVRAVKAAWVVHELNKSMSGWTPSVGDLKWQGYLFGGLAPFLARHFDHGGFYVQGEYQSDPKVPVSPECPPGAYEAVCKDALKAEVEDLEARVAELKKVLK